MQKMEYRYNKNTQCVQRKNGFAVLMANCDPTQGGLPSYDAERCLRTACIWLNEKEQPEEEKEVRFTIRPHQAGCLCIAYVHDAADPKNWRKMQIAADDTEAGAIVNAWAAFYAAFDRNCSPDVPCMVNAPYVVNELDGECWVCLNDGDACPVVAMFNAEHPDPRTAAEAECARLNAEYALSPIPSLETEED